MFSSLFLFLFFCIISTCFLFVMSESCLFCPLSPSCLLHVLLYLDRSTLFCFLQCSRDCLRFFRSMKNMFIFYQSNQSLICSTTPSVSPVLSLGTGRRKSKSVSVIAIDELEEKRKSVNGVTASSVLINGMDFLTWESNQLRARKVKSNAPVVGMETKITPPRSLRNEIGTESLVKEKRNSITNDITPSIRSLVKNVESRVNVWSNMHVVEKLYQKKIESDHLLHSAQYESKRMILPKHVEEFLLEGTFTRDEIEFWYNSIGQWNTVKNSSLLLKLWRTNGYFYQVIIILRSFPACLRGWLWPLCIPNIMNLQENAYQAVAPHSGFPFALKTEPGQNRRKSIELDALRMFEESLEAEIWQNILNDLKDVLEAFCNLSPTIGYIQGMSYLALVFLIYMDKATAFYCFANLVHSPYSAFTLPTLLPRFSVYDYLLKYHHPSIYQRLCVLDIPPSCYLFEWHITLFCRILPINIVSRVWDAIFYGGEIVIVQCSVAVLVLIFETAFSYASHDLIRALTSPHVSGFKINENQMMKLIRDISLPDAVRSCLDRVGNIIKSV